MKTDIAIVGYGPVGATAAALLAGKGLDVVVIEKAADIFDKPRAITADHEVMRIMQFAGIGDAFGAHVKAHVGTQYLGADGSLIKVVGVVPPPYPLGWPTGVHFIQPEFEAMLRAEVKRRQGVQVLLAHEVVGVADHGDRVQLRMRTTEGEDRDLDARYVLACDGASSFIRKILGVELEDLEFDEPWIVVDAWQKRASGLPSVNTQYCCPSRPGTYVIGPGNLRRWEIKLLPGEDPKSFAAERHLLPVLKEFVDIESIELWRAAVYRFHALVATTWRRGQIFLLGDSVHQTPPFMGQGMCAGIRDASNLAWKILAVETQGATSTILDSYEIERRPHVRKVIELAKQRGLTVGELDPDRAKERDALVRREREQGGDALRHEFIPGLETGLLDRFQTGRPTPGAGGLVPQPFVSFGGSERRMDDVIGSRFVAFSLDVAHFDQLHVTASDTLAKLNCSRVVLSPGETQSGCRDGILYMRETASLLSDWMMSNRGVVAIVRPDRYVYGIATSKNDLQRLIDNLKAGFFPEKRLGVDQSPVTK